MAVNNSLVKTDEQKKKPAFSEIISSVPYQRMICNTLKDRNTANRFVASIVSAVATSPALQECEAKTIVSAALLGEGLKLSPSPQLGQYYLVPFKDKKNKVTNAQFVLGYKGYIQLATRSGQYKRINAMAIKEGELINYNPFDDEIEFEYCSDEVLRDSLPTIGYYAMFEYHNGFKKIVYWSKEKMLMHADKYSAAFSLNGTSGQYAKVSYADFEAGKYNKKDEWLYSSFWYKDFDGMACKTMLRQLISKWGIMSIEMQRAYEADGGVIGESGEVITEEVIAEEPITEEVASPENIIDAEIVTESTGEQKSFEEIMEG
ncbi:MAG: recombinase RecT [Ruminococcus sp.]|nr:recombinase RecT [Ruminococcus sp.]